MTGPVACGMNGQKWMKQKKRQRAKILLMAFFLSLFLTGCEDTNIPLAVDAGLDAVRAVTLSDGEVHLLAVRASGQADRENRIASPESPVAQRLERLTGGRFFADGYSFDFKVYLSDQVNAFAMADGTIRIYSGLMDMMSDDELLFVVGHEMGHVVKKHMKKKIMLAYAASALRKGVAAQGGLAGEMARSGIGTLVQALMNAQFSQEEERQADDYGIWYLKEKGRDIQAAVSALEKLDTLGSGHSFLSSHPAPLDRARRLRARAHAPATIEGRSFLETLVRNIRERLKG